MRLRKNLKKRFLNLLVVTALSRDRSRSLLVAIVGLAIALPATAQSEFKLTALDGATEDFFGSSVSISGDVAIVGASMDDDMGEGSGSAYIFHFDGNTWVEEQKLTAVDGAEGDRFGSSVSISGDRAIVGAFRDDEKGEGSGSAYIFRFDGNTWVEEQKLTADDGAIDDIFGSSVSISGDWVIVGARLDDDKGEDSGSAYMYHYNGSTWIEEQKLTDSDGAAGDLFGASVSISGIRAIVGAAYDDDTASQSGSAFMYRFNGNTWVEEQKLTEPDGEAGGLFASSVSISGDRSIVSGHRDDSNGPATGSAYIFHFNGNAWVEEQKLTAHDGAGLDYFGLSVSISGDRVIVGAQWDDDNGEDSGSAYIFRFDGSTWIEAQKLTAGDGAAGDVFAASVAISGNQSIVSAPRDDDLGAESGSAYVYRLPALAYDCALQVDVPEVQCTALVELFESTNGDGWDDNTGWLTSPVSQWQGVSVSSGSVTGIDLASNRLSGPIPAALSQLSSLEEIDLSLNQLTGSIPSQLGQLTSLQELYLADNFLDGTIPPELGGMTSLRAIDFDNNNLSGSIPAELGQLSNLEELDLDDNDISGAIPDEIGQLTSLAFISVDNNSLSGSIPHTIGQLSSLRILYVNDNLLSASLPASLASLLTMQTFDFSNTELCEPQDANFQAWLNSIPDLRSSNLECFIAQPLNGDQDVSLTPVLDWIDTPDTESYDLQLSDDANDFLTGKSGTVLIDETGLTSSDFAVPGGTLLPNTEYLWRVRSVIGGTPNAWEQASFTTSASGVEIEPEAVVARTVLAPNFPNPFVTETTIHFELDVAGVVTIEIFDIAGRLVKTVLDGLLPAGRHEAKWDGRSAHGHRVADGLYMYRLRANDSTLTRAMHLVQ